MIQQLIKHDILELLSEKLDSQDDVTVEVSLDSIFNLLEFGKDYYVNPETDENQLLIMCEEKGCLSKIERLQKHHDHGIYEKSAKILEAFYELEDAI